MDKKLRSNVEKLLWILVTSCLILFLVFFIVCVMYRNPQADQFRGSDEAKVLREEIQKGGEDSLSQSVDNHSGEDGLSQSVDNHSGEDGLSQSVDNRNGEDSLSQPVDSHGSSESTDKHTDGLLNSALWTGFDEQSCLSRHQSILYRKASPHKPSPYLLSRLRKYEALHKTCGPYTKSYNETIGKLKSGRNINPVECNYVVWVSEGGLGNRILALASAFLYALLTNRVLLVERGTDMVDLFCEPFPGTSWLLPLDFPINNQFNSFHQTSPHSYGNMLKNNLINASIGSIPPYVYLHLVNSYGKYDKLFFCDQEQTLLQKVPWLIMRSNTYTIPSFFLISSFKQELNSLFPFKETVFHHLGRYLFHPSNVVWGLITRFYEAYLAKADKRLGVQIREFESGPGPFPLSLDQIRACYLKEKLLPEVTIQESNVTFSQNGKSIAVLITSLHSDHSKSLRNMYSEQPTVTGEIVGIFQPSSEEYQQSEKLMHNRKAWAEIYLLGMTDDLITSSWSTFGYVAQGLGGLKPWILTKPMNFAVPDPPCSRDMSMEPCFHAPPYYDCKAKTGVDTGSIIPHVRRCQDVTWGVKLVDHAEL